MVKKIVYSIPLALMLTSSLEASWGDFAKSTIDSYKNDISSRSTSAYTFKTQTTMGGQGPSMRVRWRPMGRINPINVDPPKFSVGCNGIDLSMGGFSFLGFDELVNKLKMIAASAPAFAFKMAIDTVCSQCSSIMQDIEEIVDDINSMSLDACQASQTSAEYAGRALGATTNQLVGSNVYDDSVAANKERQADQPTFVKAGWNDLKSKVAGYSADIQESFLIKEKMYGSFLNNARRKLSSAGGIDGIYFVEAARALVGDVIVYSPNGLDTPEEIMGDISIQNYYNAVVDGNTSNFAPIKITLRDETGIDVTDVVSSIPVRRDKIPTTSDFFTATTNLKTTNEAMLNSVIGRLKGKGTLSNDEKNYIFNLPGNGYLMINNMVTKGDTSEYTVENISEALAIYFADIQLQYLLSETKKIAAQFLVSNTPKDEKLKDMVVRLIDRIDKKQTEADEFFREHRKNLKSLFGGVRVIRDQELKETIKQH